MKFIANHPPSLVKQFYNTERFYQIKTILGQRKIKTVCQEALCPNMSECFSQGRVTFLILGNRCSRVCYFCFIEKGQAEIPQEGEIKNIAEVVKEIGLRHVVITSVTRDDLPDKGAGHFVKVVEAIREKNLDVTIETLIPDFGGERNLIELVCESGVDILNHNIETVPRLYSSVRPQADYFRSLNVLKIAKDFGSLTKSSIMLGMGEKESEVIEVFKDLLSMGVDILTVGQYLKPGRNNLEVREFIPLEKFEFYREFAYNIGFKYVSAGPFVRSSYGAEKVVTQNKKDTFNKYFLKFA